MFHATWEPRVHALTIALGATGRWNLDMSRSARETLPDYLNLTYYEIWLHGLEKLLIEKGLVTSDELSAGCARLAPVPVGRVLKADQVAALLAKGAPTERASVTPARFKLGQRVRTRRTAAEHHTRLPGYVRGKRGVVERVLGAHVFADSHAQGAGGTRNGSTRSCSMPQSSGAARRNWGTACHSTPGNPILRLHEHKPAAP